MRKTLPSLHLKNWILIPGFFLLLGLILPVFSCSAHSDPGRNLTVIYANRINGQLDPCG